MSAVTATLATWARRTRSSFAPLAWLPSRPAPLRDAVAEAVAENGLVYRLKRWPDLPSAARTADVLRLLSVMSHRPVNRRWMLSYSRLDAEHVDALLRRLVDRGDVDVIDASGFPVQA
ncbi:hypothetical protein RAMLITH_15075 [Ramlibacter sp. RBP-2]|uniref:Uncharacterized protein n=1 Tax=Ramlibacter lithotrophicus TaxID=2606681 RepID=A0A7X6DH98_9BURK|nr:hypothetical protein [Ramlibacter lithotrophicus]NKE67145.1 hypothetical protein [Ramlibacter lithotrophicus]